MFFVKIVLQRSVTRLLLSEVCNCRENCRVAITGRRYVMTHAMRSSSQSRPVINFHWPIVHSRFHDIKYYVFWTGYFGIPARSLNTPRWVITRVLPGADRGTFVIIVGALVTWAIYTQGQLLLVVSLIIRGVVPGYKIAQVTRAPTITQTVQNELYCSVHSCFWQSGRKMDWTKVP